MTTRSELEAQLLAPDGMFATTTDLVPDLAGNRTEMTVFASRFSHLREALAFSAGHGEAEYIVFGDRRITFAENVELIAALADGLATEHGIGHGSRIAILAANSAEWIHTFWAGVSLGALVVAMNGWWAGDEVRFALGDSEPDVLVGDAKRLARLDGDNPGCTVLTVENDIPGLIERHRGAALPEVDIAEDDPAVILYTSGTTGRPKGAVQSHRNVIASMGLQFFHGARTAMLETPDPDASPRKILMQAPLFHVSGLHAGAISMLVGGTTGIWLTGRFDPAAAARIIEDEQITNWSALGNVINRFVADPAVDGYDLSSLTHLGGGGAPISPDAQERYRRLFPNVKGMGYGYGLTESGALVSITFDDEWRDDPTTVGEPLPTIDVEIRDAEGTPLPEGEEGEICVRSAAVMLGYWRRPEVNAVQLVDGWLRTGDIGRFENGRLYLASRRRDLIIRGGENVYPVEIEACLEERDDVAEAAVIGVDDEELGEIVKAVVVPARGATLDSDALSAHVAGRLAAFKVPAVWEIRSEPLPRTATDKVLKNVLRGDDVTTFIDE